MNTNSSLATELKDQEYREAYVASQIKIGLPFQIRSLRKSRGLSQLDLAELAGMSQPRISEIETPGARSLTLETLLKIATAFDVGLNVRFVPFSTLVDWVESVGTQPLSILPFAADLESLTAELQRPPDQFSPITEGSSATKLNLANSGFTNFQYRYVWDAVSRITSNEKPTEESLFTQMVRGESNENQLNFIG